MKKIFRFFSTRPQIIKASKFIKIFTKNNLNIQIINSSQHYDPRMFDSFINEFDLKNIKIQNFKYDSKKIFIPSFYGFLDKEIKKKHPDFLINFGDTNTTLISSLVAKKNNIKLIHIESGLRSYNRNQQEEINRVISDNLSDLKICPTKSSLLNLKKEGLEKNSFFVGDLMYELFFDNVKNIKDINYPKPYIYLTLHRSENVDEKDKLMQICQKINLINSKNLDIYLPIHHRILKFKSILKKNILNLKIMNPLTYNESLNYLSNSKFVITDSGGLQKEAHFLKKRCYVLRKETEWIEAVQQGYSILLNKEKNLKKTKINLSVYGNKKIAEKTSKIILKFISKN